MKKGSLKKAAKEVEYQEVVLWEEEVEIIQLMKSRMKEEGDLEEEAED